MIIKFSLCLGFCVFILTIARVQGCYSTRDEMQQSFKRMTEEHESRVIKNTVRTHLPEKPGKDSSSSESSEEDKFKGLDGNPVPGEDIYQWEVQPPPTPTEWQQFDKPQEPERW
ncbi:uncharacterized protein LOC128987594 [Macrosteles quadrilineatus]|uniref:uncharacterized protein LOC128987594 n=1 Tax=Macrosteles quadrilineatus TaxID=74068 RepID=UPI0023E33CCF|nr:uncharacterized protein LOC128987594 [Macrosteles quadrilineatus]